jgi:hypothetical protein
MYVTALHSIGHKYATPKGSSWPEPLGVAYVPDEKPQG